MAGAPCCTPCRSLEGCTPCVHSPACLGEEGMDEVGCVFGGNVWVEKGVCLGGEKNE